MRLKSFFIQNVEPIKRFDTKDLSDVVVLAGPNGVGKTRLIQHLINFFRNPVPNSNVGAVIEATSDQERTAWGKSILDTKNATDSNLLKQLIQRSQRRNKFRSTFLNFESDRTIRQIRNFDFSWSWTDPYEEEIGWDTGYSFLRDRFQDVQHTLFKRVEGQRRKIAEEAERLKAQNVKTMDLDFPDPLEPFKAAFSSLLAPKKLEKVDLQNQQILYTNEAGKAPMPLENLSSGEREVVNIIFDVIIRNPSHCIIFFDEPELHLHPELSYKLLQGLSRIGKSNQFILCTHSPEIITASIENSVLFVAPPKNDSSNQAIHVNREDETHHALNLLGQSIGIISLGKKLLLIEGEESSLDKQTYGAILRNEFPELVLVPVGGKHTINTFKTVQESILNRTIWGVQFFMLCDRDAVNELGPESVKENLAGNLKVLPRYHLENYFLDETIIAEVFRDMEPTDSWLRNPTKINETLRSIASKIISYTVALKVSAAVREKIGNIDIMPKGLDKIDESDHLVRAIHERSEQEIQRIKGGLELKDLQKSVAHEFDLIKNSIGENSDTWKREIPGRTILNQFAARAKVSVGRLKRQYIAVAQEKNLAPFNEIVELFRAFSALHENVSDDMHPSTAVTD